MTAETTVPAIPESDLQAVERLGDAYRRIAHELGKVVIGQKQVIEELLIAMLAGGHCLLLGVPGLAKTLMVRALADTLDLSFNRIQFTPDLMPADITGTEVIQEDKATGRRDFRFLEGAVFANVVLADEINRTPPKTQAALLEAMQEHQVTAGGQRHRLPDPFFVLATQNPIEQEGTYPLPEAQLDRFMFEILVDYPSEQEEFEIVRQTTAEAVPEAEKVLSRDEIKSLQTIVRRIPVADHIIRYAMQFPRLTRRNPRAAATPSSGLSGRGAKGEIAFAAVPDFITQYVSWGAGPRASQYLILGGKARAALHGRAYVSMEDVRAVAKPVLRHRIITNFNAEADGLTADQIIERLIAASPSDGSGQTGRLPHVFKKAEAS